AQGRPAGSGGGRPGGGGPGGAAPSGHGRAGRSGGMGVRGDRDLRSPPMVVRVRCGRARHAALALGTSDPGSGERHRLGGFPVGTAPAAGAVPAATVGSLVAGRVRWRVGAEATTPRRVRPRGTPAPPTPKRARAPRSRAGAAPTTTPPPDKGAPRGSG